MPQLILHYFYYMNISTTQTSANSYEKNVLKYQKSQSSGGRRLVPLIRQHVISEAVSKCFLEKKCKSFLLCMLVKKQTNKQIKKTQTKKNDQ